MDIKKKLQDFNKRWSVIDDSSYEEEFRKFKTRVINIFSDVDSHVSEESIAQFCQILGIKENWKYQPYGDQKWSENIINALIGENEEKKFYRLLQIISYLPIQTLSGYRPYSIEYSREKVFNQLFEAIELSNVNLSMTVKDDEIIFHPRGEKELDKILVDEVLSFLNLESQKHFIDALNNYQNFSQKNAIKSVESLRRSLEEFLRHKLNNQHGLDKNIQELQKRLKNGGRDPIVRNVIFQIFLP